MGFSAGDHRLEFRVSALCSLGQLVSSESVEMSEWGICVGCPWDDTPVREHSKTATSGYNKKKITTEEFQRLKKL